MIVKHNDIFWNKRVSNTDNSSLGILHLNKKPFGFVIEDEPRVTKVVGETRIPAGKYKLVIQKASTPKTLEYRAKYPWFKNHIELQNVPNFTGIYVHVGNRQADTMGCQVIGIDATTVNGEFENKNSTVLFKEWYEAVYPALEKELNIFWEVTDNKI